jgi:hypothetical protein
MSDETESAKSSSRLIQSCKGTVLKRQWSTAPPFCSEMKFTLATSNSGAHWGLPQKFGD